MAPTVLFTLWFFVLSWWKASAAGAAVEQGSRIILTSTQWQKGAAYHSLFSWNPTHPHCLLETFFSIYLHLTFYKQMPSFIIQQCHAEVAKTDKLQAYSKLTCDVLWACRSAILQASGNVSVDFIVTSNVYRFKIHIFLLCLCSPRGEGGSKGRTRRTKS